jgi:hypothetical protein
VLELVVHATASIGMKRARAVCGRICMKTSEGKLIDA